MDTLLWKISVPQAVRGRGQNQGVTRIVASWTIISLTRILKCAASILLLLQSKLGQQEIGKKSSFWLTGCGKYSLLPRTGHKLKLLIGFYPEADRLLFTSTGKINTFLVLNLNQAKSDTQEYFPLSKTHLTTMTELKTDYDKAKRKHWLPEASVGFNQQKEWWNNRIPSQKGSLLSIQLTVGHFTIHLTQNSILHPAQQTFAIERIKLQTATLHSVAQQMAWGTKKTMNIVWRLHTTHTQ